MTNASNRPWINRTVIGIIAATFFSDVGHEMVTAVLPMYLAGVGLGPAALGLMEGLADLLFSLSKLVGGVVGHKVDRKRPWATAGYLVTSVGTAAMGLVSSMAALVSLRAGAWFGRGFRAPLRDFLLADAVEPSHFGRAYGIERTGDMLGAVAGPLVAVLMLWFGCDLRTVILVSVLPSIASVASIYFLTQDHPSQAASKAKPSMREIPRTFWLLLIGVFLFGLGDFSRTFLIFLGSRALGGETHQGARVLPMAVLMYTVHNAVSALAAYPAGKFSDRGSKIRVLVFGYLLGVVTNAGLACFSGSIAGVGAAVVLSGVYIAIEETVEKATAAELLPRELRSLGFGILATANAVGDMLSSLYAGFMLDAGKPGWAFGVPSALGACGVAWLFAVFGLRLERFRSTRTRAS